MLLELRCMMKDGDFVNKEQLIEYKKKLLELNEQQKKERDIYLSKLNKGEIAGPMLGIPSIDKPWLKYYKEKDINTSMPEMSCYNYLYICNYKYLNRTALSYFGRKISFEEMFANIESTAKALKAAGVKKDEIITISLPNIPEAAYLFYACSKIGAIANMVDPRSSEEDIAKYIKEVDSKLVIIIDTYVNKIKGLVDNNKIHKVIAVSPAESLPFGLNVGYRLKDFVEKMKDSSKKIEFNDNVSNWDNFIKNGKMFPVLRFFYK